MSSNPRLFIKNRIKTRAVRRTLFLVRIVYFLDNLYKREHNVKSAALANTAVNSKSESVFFKNRLDDRQAQAHALDGAFVHFRRTVIPIPYGVHFLRSFSVQGNALFRQGGVLVSYPGGRSEWPSWSYCGNNRLR